MALTEPLDDVEARLVGVLVEKELTTPDGYPLSINALVNGSNQKSNRDPVMSLTEQTVSEALLRLRLHRLVKEVHEAGARVEKYAHLGREAIEVDTPQLAVLAELLLRGAQSAGDLRARVNRMSPLPTLAALQDVLSTLEARGLVARLPPAPGSRAPLIMHRLGAADAAPRPGAPPAFTPPAPSAPPPVEIAPEPRAAPAADPASLEGRVAKLEEDVATLRRRLDAMRQPSDGGV